MGEGMNEFPEVIQKMIRENPQIEYITLFEPSGRGKAQCPPDPAFPNGRTIDLAGANIGCLYGIPYPAPECGVFYVTCLGCKCRVAITAAGRPDDPIAVIMPCKNKDIQSCSPEKNSKS